MILSGPFLGLTITSFFKFQDGLGIKDIMNLEVSSCHVEKRLQRALGKSVIMTGFKILKLCHFCASMFVTEVCDQTYSTVFRGNIYDLYWLNFKCSCVFGLFVMYPSSRCLKS